ncbi:adenosine receptor A3-like [Oculina patagonica]
MEDTEQAGSRRTQNYCTAPLKGTSALWFLVASNVFLTITSTLGNTVILAALHKESSLHSPSKILLRSLALTDFLVGILTEPFFIIFFMTIEHENLNLCYDLITAGIFVGLLLCSVSLLTLTAISVDRLLALLLGMRYREVVTSKRVLMIVICFWILSIGLITSGLWIGDITFYYISLSVPLCLVVSTCCYTKIYLKLLHHQAQIHVHQGQPNGHEPLNIARYRKTVSSALWVQFSVPVCYLPTGIVTGLMATRGMLPSLIVAWMFSSTLTLFNSTLNPMLYCWKIKEVRRAAINTIKQLTCCGSS